VSGGERGRRPSGSSPEADGQRDDCGVSALKSGSGGAWSSVGGQYGRGWSEPMR
jgi:hypothetical protein